MSIDDAGWMVGSRIGFAFGIAFGVVGGLTALVDYAAAVVWLGMSWLFLLTAWLMKPS